MSNKHFGAWIAKLRERKGYNYVTFAEITDSAPSTVIRIENEDMGGALRTLVKLVQGLDGEISEFYEWYSGNKISHKFELGEGKYPHPTQEDVLTFIEFARCTPLRAGEILADLLNLLFERLSMPEHISNRWWGNNETEEYFISLCSKPFVPQDIIKMVGLSHIGYLKIQYPLKANISTIMNAYDQDGFLVYHDLKKYLKHKSSTEASRQRSPTQREIEKLIEKLFNPGYVRNTKLANALKLDELLEDNGRTFLFIWRVAETELLQSEDFCYGIGETLVYLSRWIEALELVESNWLDKIRDEMALMMKNNSSPPSEFQIG